MGGVTRVQCSECDWVGGVTRVQCSECDWVGGVTRVQCSECDWVGGVTRVLFILLRKRNFFIHVYTVLSQA